MIGCSISFLIFSTSSGWTILGYCIQLYKWYRAGDLTLLFDSSLLENYLNEVPMTRFLQKYTEGENPAVTDYYFKSVHYETLMEESSWPKLYDLSQTNNYWASITAVPKNLKAS